MSIVNQTIPRALRRLGYSPSQIDAIVAYIDENKSLIGCPDLRPEHLAGVRLLDGRQHHPLPGPRQDDGGGPAVHLRRHLQDGQHARGGHGRRRRAAPHRRLADGRQGRRHLPRQLQGGPAAVDGEEGASAADPAGGRHRGRCEKVVEKIVTQAQSARSCPATAPAGPSSSGWPTARASSPSASTRTAAPARSSMNVSKQGSTLAGIMDAFAISVSHGLQYGVPLRAFVETLHQHALRARRHDRRPRHPVRHRASSTTSSAAWRSTTCRYEERAELGILTIDERTQPTLPGVEESVAETVQGQRHRARPGLGRVGRPRCSTTRCRRPPAAAGSDVEHRPRRRRPDVHDVRCADDPGRQLPRLPQLRQHQRLQLT